MPTLSTTGPRAPKSANWTTRRWLTIGVSVSLTVLTLLSVLGVWVFNHAGAVTNRLVDGSSPALIAAVQLQGALVDQETGIRGYGLTGRSDFLQPYTQGLADERTQTALLRSLLKGDRQGTADLDLVVARARTWQSGTAQPIAAAPESTRLALATERAETGKAAFDAFRAASDAEQRHLTQERVAGRADLQSVRSLRNLVFTAIAVVILLLAVLVFAGLRRGVTAPLERLSEEVQAVADGDFARPITATGPADLRRLASVVESMRRRLADELEFSDSVRLQLDAQAVDLRRSNDELEQFAYVASHDLQEPLRKIASFCQLLQRRYAGSLDARADQYIAFAVDGANRMQTLINDLLAFSRVGRLHNTYATVDLERVLATVVDSLEIAVGESGAVITHDPLPEVNGDETQLSMLLQNLVSNAVKFRTPERPPRIHLSAVREDDLWRFEITDNGIGIAPEFADRVFVIFQRLHTKDAFPGNGIGLAMCKKIVEFHGGTIAIDPDHAPGTRITFTLAARAITGGDG